MNHQSSSVPQISYQSPQVSTQPMTESPLMDSSFSVYVFSSGDDLIACLNKAMAFLTAVASSRVIVQQVQGRQGQGEGHVARQCTQPKRPRNAAWYKEKAILAEAQEAGQILDEEQLAFLVDPGVLDGQVVQTIIPNNVAFQTKDLDTYDSNCDDILNAKADFEQTPAVDFTDNEIHSDSNIIPYSQYLQETQQANANKEQNNESVTAELERYKERVKTLEQCLNIDLSSREKMIDSQMDDMIKEKLALKEQVDSLEQNLSKQIKEKESFWLRMSNPTNKPSDASPVKIEAPKELPKVSLVNESLKKLKFHLARFDNVVKIMTTPDAHTEGEWGFEHTKVVFNNEIIPFLKSLKDIFNVFVRDLLNEIMEVQTVFNQMDAVVQQSSVDKKCLEIAKKELLLENDRLLQQIMSQEVLLTVMNSMPLRGESVNMDEKRKESCNLEAELLKSQNAFNNLLKRKKIVDIVAQTPSAYTIVPGMFKLDIEPLAPRLLQNREMHIEYLKYTQEQAGILWGIVKQAKAKQPLDKELDFACITFTIVGNSCPLTRITSANVVPPKKTTSHLVETQKLELKVYSQKPKNVKNTGSSKKAKIVESKNANHSEPNHTWGSNATDIPSSFSLVMTGYPDFRFGNGNIVRIMGYGDYQKGNVTISRVYYVEGLGHNLFSVAQFCDADLEVAFRKNTCFICNLEGVDLISGSHDINLYTISLDDMLKTSPIYLLSKASIRHFVNFMKMLASRIKHLLPALLSRMALSKGKTELLWKLQVQC
ncbi:hypothetical protein Tco_1166055 [Tanacetum coccineum]